MSTVADGIEAKTNFIMSHKSYEPVGKENKERSGDFTIKNMAQDTSLIAGKMRKKKTLQRENAVHADETNEVAQDGNDDYVSGDSNIFPSPVAITQEEALRETSCHNQRQNSRHQVTNSRSNNNNNATFEEGLDESYSPTNANSSVDAGNAQRRREVEKPPRLQKQASRDRLSSPFVKQAANQNTDGSSSPSTAVNGNSQKVETTECLDSMGVDVHEFLVKALQSNPRDRSILLKLEHDMVKFVNNSAIEFMRFPEMTSYHRMLVHRVAAYFGMDHNIDAKGKSVIINKTKHTRLPDTKFNEHILNGGGDLNAAQEDMRRRSILKRMQNCQSLDQSQVIENTKLKSRDDWRSSKQRSFEERENNYEKIRARIFNHQTHEDGRYPRELRNKDKERVMAQWAKRPWNSTDLSSLPGRNLSTPPATSSGSGGTKMSNSGITLLSRQNTREGGSTSSSTSSVFVGTSQSQSNDFPLTNGQHNDDWSDHSDPPPISAGHVKQPYVDHPELLACKALGDFEFCHVIDQTAKNIVVAVPLGFTVRPDTLLTHPHTGNPYVNLEGYPILYQPNAIGVPTYQARTIPVQYQQIPAYTMAHQNLMPYGVTAHANAKQNTSDAVNPQNQPLDGGNAQAGVAPSEGSVSNSGASTPLHMYQSALYHPQHYQQAPVHLVYYPTPPLQQSPHPMPVNKVHPPPDVINSSSDVINQMQSLTVAETTVTTTATEKGSADASGKLDASGENVVQDQIQDSPRKNESPTSGAATKPRLPVTSPDERTVRSDAGTIPIASDNSPRFYNSRHIAANVVSTVHTGPGSVTYYTTQPQTHDPNFPKHPPVLPGVHPGVTGHPIMPPSHPFMAQAPVYPGAGVLRPPMGEDLQSQASPVQQANEYYMHQGTPGLNFNYMTSPSPQPMYYVLPNSNGGLQQYQALPANQFHHNTGAGQQFHPTLVYSPIPHGYPQLPMQSPPYPYPSEGLNGGFHPAVVTPATSKSADPVLTNAGENDATDDLCPVLVTHLKGGDIASPALNTFAARHGAKIVQFQSNDNASDSPHSDIYLLFTSHKLAFEAIKQNDLSAAAGDPESPKRDAASGFQLSHVHDATQRREIVSQIRAADSQLRESTANVSSTTSV